MVTILPSSSSTFLERRIQDTWNTPFSKHFLHRVFAELPHARFCWAPDRRLTDSCHSEPLWTHRLPRSQRVFISSAERVSNAPPDPAAQPNGRTDGAEANSRPRGPFPADPAGREPRRAARTCSRSEEGPSAATAGLAPLSAWQRPLPRPPPSPWQARRENKLVKTRD